MTFTFLSRFPKLILTAQRDPTLTDGGELRPPWYCCQYSQMCIVAMVVTSSQSPERGWASCFMERPMAHLHRRKFHAVRAYIQFRKDLASTFSLARQTTLYSDVFKCFDAGGGWFLYDVLQSISALRTWCQCHGWRFGVNDLTPLPPFAVRSAHAVAISDLPVILQAPYGCALRSALCVISWKHAIKAHLIVMLASAKRWVIIWRYYYTFWLCPFSKNVRNAYKS